MALTSRLLNRAILSHLIVAVPPAVVLGQMVIDINESTLRMETQLLHLALATQMRDYITARVDLSAALLGHAERVLDLSEMSIEQRQDVLRALVADRQIEYLAIYRPDGTFDSSVRAIDDAKIDESDLAAKVRAQADETRMGVDTLESNDALIVVPWKREGETLGYIGTVLRASELQREAEKLAASYLGEGGEVEVVDGQRRYVFSSVAARGGTTATDHTPFSSIRAEGGALLQLEAGISAKYDIDGASRLASVVSAPRVGWLVAASRPSKVAFQSIEKMRTRVILMSLVAALAAGIVGLVMARQVSQPISRLIAQVRRVAKRGFDTEAKVDASGELGQLAEAFNGALAELSHHREQLRHTTQMRLRLGRFISKGAMHGLLASADTLETDGPPQMITLLYADVVHKRLPDSPENVGTEHLVALLGEFFSAAHESLASRGGRIDRYSGDSVIGIFAGDTTQAIASALEASKILISDANAIASRWAPLAHVELTASVGVVTGSARIAQAGDVGNEVTVSGDIVDRAAALQRAAQPGTVWIDETTQTSGKVETADTSEVDGATVFRVSD